MLNLLQWDYASASLRHDPEWESCNKSLRDLQKTKPKMLKRMSWDYASASLRHDTEGGVLQQIAARFTKNKTQNAQASLDILGLFFCCREEGIRTLDTLLAYTHFPGVRLRPLGHLSKNSPFTVKKGRKNNKKIVVGNNKSKVFLFHLTP